MSDVVRWTEVAAEVRSTWRHVFNHDQNGPDLVAPCPVCSNLTLHRWYFLERNAPKELRGSQYLGPGRLWEWCSTCRSFEYYPDGYLPAWWVATYDVSPDLLTYDPAPIEAARSRAA
jgi:hypothetical protein